MAQTNLYVAQAGSNTQSTMASSSYSGYNQPAGEGNSYSLYNQQGEVNFERELKLVVVGDGGSGKTSLLSVFANGSFPDSYVPTVFETYGKATEYKSRPVRLNLWDTAGQEDYDRLRPLSYQDADVFFICFSVNATVSLANVQDKWYPEVNHFAPNAPLFLVGLKTDLRQDREQIRLLASQGRTPISIQEGQAVAKNINAQYIECSALNHIGVDEAFAAAVETCMKASKKGIKIKKCTII